MKHRKNLEYHVRLPDKDPYTITQHRELWCQSGDFCDGENGIKIYRGVLDTPDRNLVDTISKHPGQESC